ncbi:MAG: hypothetical protein M1821_006906 [Bathelium mastoideum]|nr:MAG: hypothetical protein M1821_006906 [Bathelium mastoideum]KAI9687636.1 MAG: hypothetical protein M1822_002246 [Bathelium mastoideum]
MQSYLKSFSPKGKGVDVNEISFAKQFLTSVDQKPAKLSPDHVEDARKLPAQPAYILPKMPTTMPPPGAQPSDTPMIDAPGSAPLKLDAHLKSLRPASTLTLPALHPTTSIHSLKTQFAEKSGTGATVDKIKILLNKKPVSDSKTLAECAVGGSTQVDFSVMVVGGTPGGITPGGTLGGIEKKNPMDSVQPKPSSLQTIESEEFWTDLKGWLGMRLKDDAEGQRLTAMFREAVKSR